MEMGAARWRRKFLQVGSWTTLQVQGRDFNNYWQRLRFTKIDWMVLKTHFLF
jgi:hypothetical protein